MQDEQPETTRRQCVIIVGTVGMGHSVAHVLSECRQILDANESITRIHVAVDTQDLLKAQQEFSQAAGVAAEEFQRLCMEVDMLTFKTRIDLGELKAYSNSLLPKPSKRSRRSKRGHNRALDRIIT